MATLQVKNLDEELHRALRKRAEQEGTTLSELVVRLIRRELARPSMAEWLDSVERLPAHPDVDVVRVMDEVRVDLDRH
ncbi:MAG: FitA-like ribbon-helix-helix domain-containing protein [Micromonosporaceae bacterium]